MAGRGSSGSLDVTEGVIWRQLLLLCVPVFFSSFFQEAYSLVNTFVGMLLMWEVVYGITRGIGQKPHDKFPSIMVFGIAMQGAFSLSAMPWGGNAIANLGVYANIMGAPADVIQYVLFMLPFGVLEIMVYIALAKFIFRLDVTPLKEYKLDISAQGELAHELKTALIMRLCSLLCCLPLRSSPRAPSWPRSITTLALRASPSCTSSSSR